jgi:hypothetical protein
MIPVHVKGCRAGVTHRGAAGDIGDESIVEPVHEGIACGDWISRSIETALGTSNSRHMSVQKLKQIKIVL